MRISGTGLSHHSPFHARCNRRRLSVAFMETARSTTAFRNTMAQQRPKKDPISLEKKTEAISSSNYFSWIRAPTMARVLPRNSAPPSFPVGPGHGAVHHMSTVESEEIMSPKKAAVQEIKFLSVFPNVWVGNPFGPFLLQNPGEPPHPPLPLAHSAPAAVVLPAWRSHPTPRTSARAWRLSWGFILSKGDPPIVRPLLSFSRA